MQNRILTFAEAVREALVQSMQADPSVFVVGEGVPDPTGSFGTTKGLQEHFGRQRAWEMPLSENGMTGVCIGAALGGMRPVMVHLRIDFLLLAMDQLVNNAANWHYMFGGKDAVPLVVRVMIGRGFGNGAQHAQSLQALFAHIPGLKVVMPSSAYDAKGLLIASIRDNNPVVFIEHRWLHQVKGEVPEEPYTVPLGKAAVVAEGTDITIAATSYMMLEARKALPWLEQAGISAELIDIRSLKPLDEETILRSVEKTGRLLVADSGWYSGGFAGEILARAAEKAFPRLKAAPQRITVPDLPTPSTRALARHYYPRHVDIIRKACEIMGKKGEEIARLAAAADIIPAEGELRFMDVPDERFTGPF
ncbi:alpha-ketoacid dehydrogenase subunit beta [Candidatus Woesearchaeota archaeon]|nr:alpha-ketoacid dehydrogenase subunit beta [Candidatus Woesearchaeota archaeon]